MRLICNKHTKKLFLVLATFGAIACHTNLNTGNFKALLPGYVLLHFRAQRALKLHDFAAAETYQVVMLRGWLYFIVMVSFIKMELFY